MRKVRVIPALLLKGRGLVKTRKFAKPDYLGDPINIVKIFNEKEIDELVLLDIDATVEGRVPQFELLEEVASECFMPLCYGGGIRNVEDVRRILGLGIEKVAINSYAVENPEFIREASEIFGSQSIVVSLDVRKQFRGTYEVRTHGGKKGTNLDPVKLAQEMELMGAGELLLNSIDCDGMMQGYDISLIRKVATSVQIPVIACGGAGKIEDFSKAGREGGASAVAAGSMFVYQGRYRAVLISYPPYEELEQLFVDQ